MNQPHRTASAFIVICIANGMFVTSVHAQFGAAAAPPRPSGRVSVYTNVSRTALADGVSRDVREISTSATYSLPERDTDGLIYGFDLRHSRAGDSRADRLSVYEMYAGARAAGGRLMMRGGHV